MGKSDLARQRRAKSRQARARVSDLSPRGSFAITLPQTCQGPTSVSVVSARGRIYVRAVRGRKNSRGSCNRGKLIQARLPTHVFVRAQPILSAIVTAVGVLCLK